MNLGSKIADAARAGVKAVGTEAPGWVSRALEETGAHLDALPPEAAVVARASLDVLEGTPGFAEDAAGLGVDLVTGAISAIHDGGLEALPGALSESFEERRAAFHEATDDAIVERDRREQQKQRFMATLAAAGEAGLKAAAPLLLAAIGV